MSYFSLFQSTHPARGATIAAISSGLSTSFQSTHPARGATVRRPPFCFHFDISIHAPREGCDSLPSAPATTSTYFNPRTPRGVRRQRVCTISMGNRNFNPRTPRGVRLIRHVDLLHDFEISIHAPREGCDVQIGRRAQDDAKHFNPRTPRGVRPLIMDAFIANANFNPRTPRGVRRTTGVYLGIPQRFQSTHPARGATIGIPAGHNPLLYFNPRTPRGVRRFGCHITPLFYQFQSTHPARGATLTMPTAAAVK